MNDLSSKTKVPLIWIGAILFFALPAFAGVIIWGVNLESKTKANETRVIKIEDKNKGYDKDMAYIRESLVAIKTHLKIKEGE